MELDDDTNGDGVAKGDAGGAFVFCNNDLTVVDSSMGSDLIAVGKEDAGTFGFCNSDLTATDIAIGSDLFAAAAIFGAKIKEWFFLVLLVKLLF